MSSQTIATAILEPATSIVSGRPYGRFASNLAKWSSLNAFRKGHVLAVLRSYLDGSGATNPPAKANSLTLAGHVAKDGDWAEFERGWDDILSSHNPRASYLHMREAMFLKKEFDPAKGWTNTLVRGLLERLLGFVVDSRWNDRIYGVCCTVNLDDHERAVKEGYLLKSPRDICAAICCEKIISLQFIKADSYVHSQISPIESIDFFFDQNEPFLGSFQKLWKQHGGRKSREPTWSLVNQISPVDMRRNPPLQFADMLAWSRNRAIAMGGHADLCTVILSVTDSSEFDMNYDRLIKPHRKIVYP
jgi:Protein of unknown function (DUF3800)